MKGDFTRSTFRPLNHYSGVRQQQGRVQLDADWNEQVDIAAYRDQATTRDLVGVTGAPFPAANANFELIPAANGELEIAPGHFYVDGVLCECEAGANNARVRYSTQSDYPVAPPATDAGLYVAYLDVWQREISALERPELRETALGGPDTALRTKSVWQLKLSKLPTGGTPPQSCAQLGTWTPPNSASTGQLKAQSKAPTATPQPCAVPEGAGYNRLENQLYRVEIQQGGAAGTATYKWSRENGSVVARLTGVTGPKITVDDAGRDATIGFGPGDWVEISNEERALAGDPTRTSVMAQIQTARGNVLTLTSAPPTWVGTSVADVEKTRPSVRRWESSALTIPTATNNWIDLENGVQVQFKTDSGTTYQRGDYWLIPARTLAGDVEWPRTTGANPAALFEKAHGVVHRYAPLAILERAAGTGNTPGAWTVKSDCRRFFPPATELTSLFYISGDGQEAAPTKHAINPTTPVRLTYPLCAGVANGRFPVSGARVQFTITQVPGGRPVAAGDKLIDVVNTTNSGTSIEVKTVAGGVASCWWEVAGADIDPHAASSRPPQVTATLLIDDPIAQGPSPSHIPIVFSAGASVAKDVHFNAPPGVLNGVNTVQDALEALALANGGEPGIQIVGVEVITKPPANIMGPLDNDVKVPAEALASGLRVKCAPQFQIDPFTLAGKPSCQVSVDLPYPISDSDRTLWMDQVSGGLSPVFGTQRITLEGTVSAAWSTSGNGTNDIEWRPSNTAKNWLLYGLFRKLAQLNRSGIPLAVHFTLKGNFIHSLGSTRRWLDGDVYGRHVNANGVENVSLGLGATTQSGDNRRGGDFSMWFWLTEPTKPVIQAVTLTRTTFQMSPNANRTATGTITLNGPVVTDPVVVNLSVGPALQGLIVLGPSQVPIVAPNSSATFQVQLVNNPQQSTSGPLNVQQVNGPMFQPAPTLTANPIGLPTIVIPPGATTISFDPNEVAETNLVIPLSAPAPQQLTVTLASPNAMVAIVDAVSGAAVQSYAQQVPLDATSVTFKVRKGTQEPAADNTIVNLTATLNLQSSTIPVTVRPPVRVQSVSFSKSSIHIGLPGVPGSAHVPDPTPAVPEVTTTATISLTRNALVPITVDLAQSVVTGTGAGYLCANHSAGTTTVTPLPASVTVAAGSKTVTQHVEAAKQPATGQAEVVVRLTASAAGRGSASATVTVERAESNL